MSSPSQKKRPREAEVVEILDSDDETLVVPTSKKAKPEADPKPVVDVYTDGACPSNGFGSTVGGVGVFWGDGDPDNISETVHLDGRPVTNNICELLAIQRALETSLKRLKPEQSLKIHSDSMYCIDSCTKWRMGWKARGWRKADGKEVLNVDLIKTIDGLLDSKSLAGRVSFVHVKGHSGHTENDKVDKLASDAAKRGPPPPPKK
jgi:ribonuclease HI